MKAKNINDDSTLAYLFNKTRQGASDALQKAIDAINATIASIQTALNNKASKNGSDITNASTWRSNIGAVNKAGDTMTGTLRDRTSSITIGTVPSSSVYPSNYVIADSADTSFGGIYGTYLTTNRLGINVGSNRSVNGSQVYNWLGLLVDASGNRIVTFSETTPWRSALGLGTSGALPITIAQGGTGGTTTAKAKENLNFGTEAQNVTISNPSATYQELLLTFTCKNSSSAYVDHRMTLVISDGSIGLWDNTSSVTRWNFSSPVAISQGGTGQTAVSSVTGASNVATAASGVTINGARFTSWGKVGQIRIELKKNAAISSATTVCTLLSGKRPYAETPVHILSTTDSYGYISTDGTISINGSFATNTIIIIEAVYIIA